MADDLKISIGADVQGAVDGIGKVQGGLEKTSVVSRRASDAVTYVNRGFRELELSTKDGAAGFEILSHNLERLFFTFDTLKEQTGSAKSAISTLAGSLFSVGSILNIGIAAGLALMSESLSGTRKEATAAEKEIERYKQSLEEIKNISVSSVSDKAEGSQFGDIEHVRALAKAVQDETRSETERKNALEQLKEANKAYFGDLTLQKDSLEKLNPLVQEYTQALIQQAIVKELSGEIGKVGAEYTKQAKAVREAKDALDNYKSTLPTKATDEAGNRIFVLDKNIDVLNNNLGKQEKLLSPIKAKFEELTTALDDATIASLKFKSTKQEASTKDPELEALQKRLDVINKIVEIEGEGTKRTSLFTETPGTARPFQVEKLQLEAEIEVINAKKLGLSPEFINDIKDQFQKKIEDIQFPLKPSVNIRTVEIPDSKTLEIESAIAKAAGFDKKIPVITLHEARVKILGGKITAEIEGKEKIIANLTEQIKSILQDSLSKGFEGIGQGIGSALGGAGIENLGKALIDTLGDALESIGKAAIAAGVKILLLKQALKAFTSNPGLLIVAGIGLEIAGAAIKAEFNKSLPKFAAGGIATGPTFGIFGEAGAEAIIPLNKLPGIIGRMKDGNQPIILSGNLSVGLRSLSFALQRQSSSNNRLGGPRLG